MVLQLLDVGIIFAITLFSFLLGGYIGYKFLKPRLLNVLRGSAVGIASQIGDKLAKTIEDVDVGEILGQIQGGEGGGEGIGGLPALAEGLGIDLGPLAGLMSLAGGKKGGSTTKNPFLKE